MRIITTIKAYLDIRKPGEVFKPKDDLPDYLEEGANTIHDAIASMGGVILEAFRERHPEAEVPVSFTSYATAQLHLWEGLLEGEAEASPIFGVPLKGTIPKGQHAQTMRHFGFKAPNGEIVCVFFVLHLEDTDGPDTDDESGDSGS